MADGALPPSAERCGRLAILAALVLAAVFYTRARDVDRRPRAWRLDHQHNRLRNPVRVGCALGDQRRIVLARQLLRDQAADQAQEGLRVLARLLQQVILAART